MKSKTVNDKWVPLICLLSPIITYLISINSSVLFGKYEFAEELIIINGFLTFIGLLIISKPTNENTRF